MIAHGRRDPGKRHCAQGGHFAHHGCSQLKEDFHAFPVVHSSPCRVFTGSCLCHHRTGERRVATDRIDQPLPWPTATLRRPGVIGTSAVVGRPTAGAVRRQRRQPATGHGQRRLSDEERAGDQPERAAGRALGHESDPGEFLPDRARPAVRRRRRQPPGPRVAHRPGPSLVERTLGRFAGRRAKLLAELNIARSRPASAGRNPSTPLRR